MTANNRYIGPTPERLARAGRDVEPFMAENNRPTVRLLDGSPLEKLATRKEISGDQYHAGRRYFSDWYLAGFAASGVIDFAKERVDTSDTPDISNNALAAQTRYAHALKALDADSAHILSDVVLTEMPLNIYADRFREFPQYRERRAIALNLLRKALGQLDRHYYPPRRNEMTSGHEDGYRPIIPPE